MKKNDPEIESISEKLTKIQSEALQQIYDIANDNDLEFSYLVTLVSSNMVHDAIDLEVLWAKGDEENE
jgi:hypothetical protein